MHGGDVHSEPSSISCFDGVAFTLEASDRIVLHNSTGNSPLTPNAPSFALDMELGKVDVMQLTSYFSTCSTMAPQHASQFSDVSPHR